MPRRVDGFAVEGLCREHKQRHRLSPAKSTLQAEVGQTGLFHSGGFFKSPASVFDGNQWLRICVFLLVALIIASPALCRKSKNKLKCDPLDLENVDCTECYDKNGDPVPVPTPPNGYKRKTTCHCKCDFGCVRDIGAPTRECRYRSGRQCDPPTIPPTYVSSNCSELTEYPAGTICLYECPPGCPAPPEENRRQYCGNGRWRWNPRICPPCIDGGWSDWVNGTCNVTCGVGEIIQSRECNNPEPSNGGADCTREDGTTGLDEQRSLTCIRPPCPIDGGWSEWVDDGPCSATCGDGMISQSRTCTEPSPAYGGADCTLEDDITTGLTESRTVPCNIPPCPIVDGGWSEWVEGECSVTCGVGEKTRTRNCNNPSPAHGGAECTLEDGTTGLEETKIIPCDEGPCPIDGGWSEWVEGECSVTCGVGEKTRTRNCNNPSPAHGGAECTLEDGVTTGLEETKIIPCDEGPCPIDGGWSEWVEGECSVTCGVGEKTRTRNCNNPSPAHGGAECTLEDGVTTGLEETKIIPCDEGPCPIDGGWSEWVEGECSVTCGVGEKTRTRNCNNPSPAHGGAECTLEDGVTTGLEETKIIPCDEGPCPIVDGGWSEWEDYGSCSVTCGDGEVTQVRHCNNPSPAHGGADCTLEDGTTGRIEHQTVSCNDGPCPIVDGGWSDWVDGTCSVSCGHGLMTQTRTCNNPEPAHGGEECTRADGTSGLTDERAVYCNEGVCPIVDGDWSDWVDGECSVTCDDGEMTQTRTCDNPEPANGGAECTLEDGITTGLTEDRTVSCNLGNCPMDGGWSDWVDGTCTVTCGHGLMTRTRNCDNPPPTNGGDKCMRGDGTSGLTEERTVTCDEGYCPIVDGGWSDWVDGECSVTCGVGEKTQTRSCDDPEPAYGGTECTLEDGITTGLTESRTVSCDEGPCPIDGGWSDWVDGECSPSCGHGLMTQTRTCNNPEPAHGGDKCALGDGTTGLTEEKIIYCYEGPCPGK
ncbi:hypothetical protein Bbelb_198170 [Branchiostoma belcheri]|nr:hypothetical protein Bbelb_198170 [Branchiostoma belcheri]